MKECRFVLWIITNFGQFVILRRIRYVQRTHRLYCLTFDGRGIVIRLSMSGPPLSSPAMSNLAKSSVNVQSCNFSQPIGARVAQCKDCHNNRQYVGPMPDVVTNVL